jgi:hypothetical protein
MAQTTTRSRSSPNGNVASDAVAKVKDASGSVTTAARSAKTPLIAAGTTAAGLAGGIILGSRFGSKRQGLSRLVAPRRKVLGVPVGRKSGLELTAEALGKVADGLTSATDKVSGTTDDVSQIREQLEQANRQSPIEVLLDGLTHRRGAHKQES